TTKEGGELMKKVSMRVDLISSVLFIALGRVNVSIAQEFDTANNVPVAVLGYLDTSNMLAEEVARVYTSLCGATRRSPT
uniref:hypothetical protein n=1 Tax=Listeria monocytogenes TaxID=1639 RepID=UPI00196953F1